MKLFKIVLHRKAVKELNTLSPSIENRVREAIKEMKINPFSGDVKPVKGLRGVFRRRVGNYRIIWISMPSVNLLNRKYYPPLSGLCGLSVREDN